MSTVANINLKNIDVSRVPNMCTNYRDVLLYPKKETHSRWKPFQGHASQERIQFSVVCHDLQIFVRVCNKNVAHRVH